jgi:hypothetical protein
LKTWYAITFYVLATCVLVACAAIIVGKLLFFPPCTPTGPHGSLCAVDGWSVAGLAATVLGVAAAILTILGAFAVAYWWAELDKRVSRQVKSLYEEQKASLNKEMHSLLKEQESALNKEIDSVLAAQKTAIEDALRDQLVTLEEQRNKIEEQEQQLKQLDRELAQMQEVADNIIELTYSIATVNPPWELEEWARKITDQFKTPEAAKHMVLSYAKIVKGLISHDAQEASAMLAWLNAKDALLIPIPYWQQALEWEKIITRYYQGEIGEAIVAPDGKSVDIKEPEPLKLAREAIDEIRPEIEKWQNKSEDMDWYSS